MTGDSGKHYDLHLRGLPIYKADHGPNATTEEWHFILDKVEWVSNHYYGAIAGWVDPSLDGRMVAIQLSWPSDEHDCKDPSADTDLHLMGVRCPRRFPYLGDVDRSFALLSEVQMNGHWTTAYRVPPLLGMQPGFRKPSALWLVVGYRMLPSAR
jgi:hypothetical protein